MLVDRPRHTRQWLMASSDPETIRVNCSRTATMVVGKVARTVSTYWSVAWASGILSGGQEMEAAVSVFSPRSTRCCSCLTASRCLVKGRA